MWPRRVHMALPLFVNEAPPPYGLAAYRVPTRTRAGTPATVHVCTSIAERMRAEDLVLQVRDTYPGPDVVAVCLWPRLSRSVSRVVASSDQLFMASPLATYACPDPLDRLRYLQERYVEVLLRPSLPWGLLHRLDDFAAVAVWQPSPEPIIWPVFNDKDQHIADAFERTEAACVGRARLGPVGPALLTSLSLSLSVCLPMRQGHGRGALLLSPEPGGECDAACGLRGRTAAAHAGRGRRAGRAVLC
jgi:hypothetical protein